MSIILLSKLFTLLKNAFQIELVSHILAKSIILYFFDLIKIDTCSINIEYYKYATFPAR